MTRQKIKTLIVGAYARELLPFVDLGRKHCLVVDQTAYLACGIGPVAATFGITHFLEDYLPEQIVAVGTAGVIDTKRFKVSDLVCAESVSYVGRHSDVSDWQTYVPKNLPQTLDLSQPFLQLAHLPRAKVFAPQEISSGPAWRASLLGLGYQVEHLESFAYAFVAQKFGIPISIVLGLANEVGPNAHAEWQKNEANIMQKIFSLVMDSQRMTHES